ncbi:transcriptional elongation regulator MINIYO isoform X2 [Impatiens glandulifera]|uniref:transcriptional elongation regulator MINIYO isoform X2 n=1 Tax=Impatiens glandulifera TaxID=253017 RepID=UPI001FB16137|nr:transcriptional elongation regulator MINIYO isoform X2 [Impatiens glandulifera]
MALIINHVNQSVQHWVPRSVQSVGNYDQEMEEDAEDEDMTGFDPIAAFANPVKRKEKRGLDFSSWREIVAGNDPSSLKKKVNIHVETNKEGKTPGVAKVPENISSSLSTNGAALAKDVDMENGAHLLYEGKSKDLIMPSQSWEPNTEVKKVLSPEASKGEILVDKRDRITSLSQTTSIFTSKEVEDTQFSTSMEREIDAENRALLQRMTDDEIAEARAEILEKTKPSLIEALRKRGKDRLKSSSNSNSNMAAGRNLSDMQDGAYENGSRLRNDISSEETMPGSVTTRQVLASTKVSNTEVKVAQKVQDSRPGSSNLWNDWNRRVEAVRELRFSLDGDVTESDFVPELKPGASNQSGYTAENVSERDFLRTEGNPAAAGYTIKEAVALTRSVIPGQRALALHLIASLLGRALGHLCSNKILGSKENVETSRLIDWEAIWAYTLGPEPELVLSMRICLDDNHYSVVLGCTKVIHCMLSCYINEKYFDISEKLESSPKDLYTAPVFRRRPEIDFGFLHGGFWKYSTKPSNMLPPEEDNVNGEPEGEHTIKDDVTIAGQDVAAGFIRMGILPRLSYLLEANPSAALEEYIISILIAIARHSPVSTNTIMHHTRLVTILVERFMNKDLMEISSSKIKSITLLRILVRSNKKNCIQYLNDGTFQNVTWHLCRSVTYIDHWIKSGFDNCKLSSGLMVEELRFWKGFLQYGNCASYFSDFFPAICIWLNIPNFEKLIEKNLLDEYAAITREAFLVLAVLTRRLPNFYSSHNQEAASGKEDVDSWCWVHVGPMVDLAMKWIEFFKDTDYTSIIHKSGSSLLWVISAVFYFLSGVLERVIPDDTACFASGHLPYLPDFIPRIGLGLVKNEFSFTSWEHHSGYATDPNMTNSYIEYLCYLRKQGEDETSLASVCCLTGVVQVVNFVKRLIHLAKPGIPTIDNTTLPDQILKSALSELRSVLNIFMQLISSEWDFVQSVETFGRAGPVPGVGLGWGATKGGFWSDRALRVQTDAALVVNLLDVFKITFHMDFPTEDRTFTTQWIVSALELCLTVMPKSGLVLDKVFDLLFQVPVLEYLGSCIRGFIHPDKQPKSTMELKEEDFLVFSKTLASHFKKRWLGIKRKKTADRDGNSQKKNKKVGETLDTIHEECDMTGSEQQCTSLAVEWAHQRLPLPLHWFLSAISTANDSKSCYVPASSSAMNLDCGETADLLEVSKSGLFFLLGLEAMSSLASADICSPVNRVPIVWKMHSLSVLLFDIGVQEEEKSRFMYKELQDVYGQILDKSRLGREETIITYELLKFQSEIQESYDTFLENFVDQFSAVSYGDEVYGRQLAIYLHRCVETPVRLSAWTILANAHVLELLPPLENCIAEAEGYLEPPEEDEKILEAYLKSWESGNLDRSVTRGSLAYRLVLHHLSSFIFFSNKDDKLTTRYKLARSLLRDYSRKQQHEVMMMNFVEYQPARMNNSSLGQDGLGQKFEVLREACEGSSLLLREVEKLRLACHKNAACGNK